MSEPARLLLDEMLTARIAVALRERGYDVIGVVEDPALISVSDEDLLSEATRQGRCVVTANVRDFAALSAEWARDGRVHAGVVHLVSSSFPQNRSYVGAIVTALDAALRAGEIPGAGEELFLRRRLVPQAGRY